MSKTISVETLLNDIEQAQTSFAREALSKEPDVEWAAHYHHGVYRGMEAVKQLVINILKQDDDRERFTRDERSGFNNHGSIGPNGKNHVY